MKNNKNSIFYKWLGKNLIDFHAQADGYPDVAKAAWNEAIRNVNRSITSENLKDNVIRIDQIAKTLDSLYVKK